MIVVYLVSVTALGAYLSRRSRSSNQWAVAGGGMGTVMMAMGIAGTRIGGAGTYGVAGDVVTEGLWNLWYGASTFMALALVGLFFAKAYRRLELHTVGEIFWLRFQSRRCQRLTSLCVQTEYLVINIIEPYVIGKILHGVTGIDFGLGVFIGAAVIVTYTALGGLWGAAATNVVHCTVILVGLLAVIIAGAVNLGGWSEITAGVNNALAASGKDPDAWWSFTGAGWGAIIAMILSAVIHTPAASVYVNFSSAAKNERVLLHAFLIGGVVGALMPLLAGLIGMETLAKYGAESQLSSYSTITQLATDVNPWIGGFALAAILAAVISSGGPILLSSSTMFVNDWLPFSRNLSSAGRLRSYQITTLIYGFFAAAIAWKGSIGSILDFLLLGFAAVVPPAIAVGYLIYWKRTTEIAAFWGITLGYGIGVAWWLTIQFSPAVSNWLPEVATQSGGVFDYCFVQDGIGVDPSYITTFIPLFVVPIFSLMTRDQSEGKDEFYAKIGASA
jgi:SSS family solute:Na+ symporter